MKIELIVNGEIKTYIPCFISGRLFRNAIRMQRKVQETGLSVETLDELVGFVVTVFNNQFTIDDFYDGVEAKELFPTIMNIIGDCINVSGNKEKN